MSSEAEKKKWASLVNPLVEEIPLGEWLEKVEPHGNGDRLFFRTPALLEEESRTLERALHDFSKQKGLPRPKVLFQTGLSPAPVPAQGSFLKNIKNVLAVASGKGGVGKSTVAVNLALGLLRRGLKVGLLDADLYGPSAPKLLGAEDVGVEKSAAGLLDPPKPYGLPFLSMALLQNTQGPVLWRGPLAAKMIQQFLTQADWGQLDVLVVDLPPGTGDIQLTLVQSVPLAGAVIVTTPQDLAQSITRRGLKMFETVQVPIIGVVENMASFICPHCRTKTTVFAEGGGRKMAESLGVPFLGEVPLDGALAAAGDRGEPPVLFSPQSPSAEAFQKIALRCAALLDFINRSSAEVRHRPVEVDTRNPKQTVIRWDDGAVGVLENRLWRSLCPCAQCVDEITGERKIRLEDIHPNVQPIGIHPVGRYALHVQWSDGHGSGLFAFNRLREMSSLEKTGDRS